MWMQKYSSRCPDRALFVSSTTSYNAHKLTVFSIMAEVLCGDWREFTLNGELGTAKGTDRFFLGAIYRCLAQWVGSRMEMRPIF